MKKFGLFCLLLAFAVVNANAEAVEIDGIYYNLVSKAKTAEVTSNPNKYSGEVVIPETVEFEGATYRVTSIGDPAFGNCTGLTSITIPNSVTSIGEYSFINCSGLNSIAIPNSVTTVGTEAFYNCSSLTSVIIPNSVTRIWDDAFERCYNLNSVHITDLEAWCKIGFTNFSANPLSYAHHLFLNDEEIYDLIIPNSVTTIGKYAFDGCSGLTSVTIPNCVTSIGEYAFEGCSGLTSVTIPNSVTSIEGYAFQGCSGLISVSIGSGVTSIGGSTFNNCYNLTSVTISNNVKKIESGAFSRCRSLTSINIPNGVTDIGYLAFGGCSGLTSVTIPNSVKVIGQQAFYGCSGLISISIGSSVTNVESNAFGSCPEITDVYCYAENVPTTSSDVFEGSYIEYATLHVPAASIDDYKAAEPWKNFKSIIDLDGNVPETQKCSTPVIIYENGKLMFACATEGVEYVTDITCADIKKHYSSAIDLTGTYTVSVYATKAGYDNSDVATKEIQISGSGEGPGKRGDLNNDGEVNAADAVTLVNIIMNNQ